MPTTFEDHFKLHYCALSAPGSLPNDEMDNIMGLAHALWHERQRYIGMHDDALGFMDTRVIFTPSINWCHPDNHGIQDFSGEARYRYEVANELWMTIKRNGSPYILMKKTTKEPPPCSQTGTSLTPKTMSTAPST